MLQDGLKITKHLFKAMFLRPPCCGTVLNLPYQTSFPPLVAFKNPKTTRPPVHAVQGAEVQFGGVEELGEEAYTGK